MSGRKTRRMLNCLGVIRGESHQFYASSGRVQMIATVTKRGPHGRERKRCLLSFLRVKEMSHIWGGCFQLHLKPLKIRFTFGYPHGCLSLSFWDAAKQESQGREPPGGFTFQIPHTGSLVLKTQAKAKPAWTLLRDDACFFGFLVGFFFFLPASLWQTWCAAGKEHFHKCFILPPPGRASLEHELWPLGWQASFQEHPFSFAATVVPPGELTRRKELRIGKHPWLLPCPGVYQAVVTSLCLSFLTYKIGVVIVFILQNFFFSKPRWTGFSWLWT